MSVLQRCAALLSVVAVLGISACSQAIEGKAAPAPAADSGSAGNAPTATRSPAPTSPSSSSAAAPSVQPPPGAYPGAGGAVPPGATPITAFSGQSAIIKTPSGNIGCDLAPGAAGCGVLSYIQEQPYGGGPGGANWWFAITGDVPMAGPKGDPPAFTTGVPQVVQYGQVVYHDKYACASAENGLTCWDTTTGHGVHLNKAGASPF